MTKKSKQLGKGMKPRGNPQPAQVQASMAENSLSTDTVSNLSENEPIEAASEASEMPENSHDVSTDSGESQLAKEPNIVSANAQENADSLAKAMEDSREADAPVDSKIVDQPWTQHEADALSAELDRIASDPASSPDQKEFAESLKESIPAQLGGLPVYPDLGQLADGSYRATVLIPEGYFETIELEAEAQSQTVEGWISERFTEYLEGWFQPAKTR